MLNKNFKEFIELLNLNEVHYLLVGGYALALHGHPRYTKDIDIWIMPSSDNATKVLNALKAFGFAELDIVEEDFLSPGNVIQLGYPPNRIDLITQATGVDFAQCYQSRLQLQLDGIWVSVIDKENLKANKQATGRLQDLADIEKLNEMFD